MRGFGCRVRLVEGGELDQLGHGITFNICPHCDCLVTDSKHFEGHPKP